MANRKKKSSDLTPDGIKRLAKDKPVVYKIFNKKGENVYTGTAKKGRVEERLSEHLRGGKNSIPGGNKVKIDQHSSISDAQKSEARIISRSKPKHNKKGK